ncbi:MAG: bifunctional (p)ppGpp synthetase/guanosine-3',5'-bis(diphosphate) 3'-pyrophosphohydrolase [Acidobacteria bacterium]|nr:bifunctional (p)ppGpp synthetase/guanosine-3',5'-bis(diphosphate) 3'-pyrophosphohydrolase [Acidobacteriota bacterium]
MIRFEDIVEKVEREHPDADSELLRKAYVFSAKEHKGQVRQSGEPYLTHPLEVANILAELQLDAVTVSVGLLHDVVEDTLTSVEEIEKHFGKDVAHIVDGLTKISKFAFSSRTEKQVEIFRKMLLAMVDDIRVILVKLADRLHNMRTLQYLPPEKREHIARETLDIYAPIAHRLGMGKLRSELEDLAFSYLDPQSYQNIVSLLEKKRAVSDRFISDVKKTLEKNLKEHEVQAEIQSRIKRIYSIYQKMIRQKVTLDQIYDLIAFRIITDSIKDCYAVLGIVHNTWKPIPGRIKDYIAMPRPNLYQSLHTTIIGKRGEPFEVQIRTREMHRIAEEGIAAHWKYKEKRLAEDSEDQRFVWLRHLLEWQKEVRDPHQFLSNLRIDLYPEEVYTFTPKGEVITLPKGATPVDFAFAIHTEVGNHCVGARVNGRLVPLKYKLKNGEIVEILTSKEQEPSRDWLSFVKTSRARGRVRHWIKTKEKDQAMELGRRLLEKEAKKYRINLKKELQSDEFARICREYGYSSPQDIFSDLGYGKIAPRTVLQRLAPGKVADEVVAAAEAAESRLTSVVRRVLGKTDTPIQVKGHNDLLIYRAKCCNPIRGDDVIGYITRGKGVAVHSSTCHNLDFLLMNPERKVEVQWTDESPSDLYSVKLSIMTEDRQGILADITTAISNIKINIKDIKAKTIEDSRGVIDLTVEIADVKHLERVVRLLKEVEGVHQVERTRTL